MVELYYRVKWTVVSLVQRILNDINGVDKYEQLSIKHNAIQQHH